MNVPLWVWLASAAVFVGIVTFDFFLSVRKPHEPSFRESARWSIAYVSLAVIFGIGMGLVWGWQHGSEFFAGYVTEWSLSVDNLFVFLIIMTKFSVPRQYQQKVLLIGIVIALILRTIFILLGAAAIAQFSWVFYIFGAFLIYTAIKLAREDHDSETTDDYKENSVVRLVRRILPTTTEYHGDALTVRIDAKRFVTPMLIVMVAIGSTDLLFALDSIPAIFGLTREPYIVFTANAFALLGLRLVYLSEGLSVILGFIGVKLIFEALHTNELPFINNGEHVEWAPQIPIWFSLSFILVTLTVSTVASLVATRNGKKATEHEAAVELEAQAAGPAAAVAPSEDGPTDAR